MIRLILFWIIVSNLTWAQTEAEFKQELDKILLDRQQNLDWEKVVLKSRAELKLTIKGKRSELENIENALINRPTLVKEALKQINETLGSRPSSQRKRFYKCIKNSIENHAVAMVDSCSFDDAKGFIQEDLTFIEKLRSTISYSPKELEERKVTVSRDLYMSEERYKNTEKNLVQAANSKMISQNNELILETHIQDKRLIDANSKFINCDALTPEISLEEKIPYPGANFTGPFVGVPRDNQDGLGTCYANAAKNLLVSTSEGEDIASFLDLALLFKEDNLSTKGLDGGGSCPTLSKMEKKGYCPQSHAPAENGEKNSFTEDLMGGKPGSIYEQSILVDLLQKFFISQEVVKKNNKQFSDKVLGEAKIIIHNLKAHPHIKIPFPVVRYPIPNLWKLKEALHLKSSESGFSADQFLADYKSAYQKFYPSYVKLVVDGKSRDQMFSLFELKMKDFITKYSLENSMSSWKIVFMNDTARDWNDPNLKKEITSSMEFMKVMAGKTNTTDEEFIEFCDKTAFNFEYLSSLQSLVKHLQDKGANADVLYDENGSFKSQVDLMQLAIAPACLNPENRKMPKSGILCLTGYDTISKIKKKEISIEDQKKMLREKIVASLVQGYALGNTFDKHINTIVGMRFNPVAQKCEFKIRESQNGTSMWQAEDRIFNKIQALTEVRRK